MSAHQRAQSGPAAAAGTSAPGTRRSSSQQATADDDDDGDGGIMSQHLRRGSHDAATSSSSSTTTTTGVFPPAGAGPDPARFVRLADGVVKSRTGSVLSRGLVLKADYSPRSSPVAMDDTTTSVPSAGVGGIVPKARETVHLRGATNFRAADDAQSRVYGVAQPTETGIRTILSVLGCRETAAATTTASAGGGSSTADDGGRRRAIWYCTREEPVVYIGAQPFVLRDALEPTRTYALSDRAESLEQIERRLKQDIVKEAARYGGVVLVHEECVASNHTTSSVDDPASLRGVSLVDTWVNADAVRTVRDMFEQVASTGYRLSYYRIPVTRDESPGSSLDRYVNILRREGVTQRDCLVFNCGAGVKRTTFAMAVALLVQRARLAKNASDVARDAAAAASLQRPTATLERQRSAASFVRNDRALKALRDRTSEQSTRDQSLLRLIRVLQRSLAHTAPNASSSSSSGAELAVHLLAAQPRLLDNLRAAVAGSFDLILSLLSILDDGAAHKQLVDDIIDRCDAVTNIREAVVEHRVRHASLALLDEASSRAHRHKALAALERYFYLIAFAAYVAETDIDAPARAFQNFSTWLAARPEIAKMIQRLRKTGHFYVFSPIHDLSLIARGVDAASSGGTLAGALAETDDARGKADALARSGDHVIGDEWARQIVHARRGVILRTGMILKHDQWLRNSAPVRKDPSTSSDESTATEREPDGQDTPRPTTPTSSTPKSPTSGAQDVRIVDPEGLAGQQNPEEILRRQAREDDVRTDGFDGVDEQDDHGAEDEDGVRARRPSRANPETSRSASIAVRGALNFRRIPRSSLYALSQPTSDGLGRVLERVSADIGSSAETERKIVWVNLREEPLIYINGAPYVLRQEAVSLRNVKSYAGISSSRLELLEERLKSDLLAELKTFDGRLLLHTEMRDGSVVPVWETVDSPESVKTLREMMDEAAARLKSQGTTLRFHRIPITAERAPDFTDIRDLVEIVTQMDVEHDALIVNCQLGRGRSARALVVVALVQRWLRAMSGGAHALTATQRSTRHSYTVINNLLRVIRSGQEVKNAVDDVITQCGYEVYDLLDAIEEARRKAIETHVESPRRGVQQQRAVQNLRSYFFMILFAAYLNETRAETWRELRESSSYESFVKSRPVFKTIESTLEHASLDALTPIEKPLEAGNALSGEVSEFVAKRSGRVLSAFTMLKSDFFLGLQKMSLPERIEGLPNFRRVPLASTIADGSTATPESQVSPLDSFVFGTGMPRLDGLRRGLERMNARNRTVVWTCLREEPTIYVSSRPHVLRLNDKPLENVVTTGITADIVESMERALKHDLLKEAEANDGKVLLHDEVEEADGSFSITAVWEDVKAEDILTPREVFQQMVSEGLHVDYERLPVTDEQAPIPGVYSRIEERVSAAMQRYGEGKVDFANNCQMGRGRTTTGMVATWLVFNVLVKPQYQELSASFIEVPQTPSRSSGWGDDREALPYLDGEYKVILQLVALLQHGKLAKKLTDRAIDSMEGVQNLRRAVYDLKLRYNAADSGSEKQRSIFHVATNYLYRYGTLITFANYLLEKAEMSAETDTDDDSRSVRPSMPPFPQWLSRRREITNALSRQILD